MSDGLYEIQELNGAAFPIEDCNFPPPEPSDGSEPSTAGETAEDTGLSGFISPELIFITPVYMLLKTTIDVMVLYTPAALTTGAPSGAGNSTAVMNAEIQASVDQANTIYDNSGIWQQIRLVHKAQISPFTESGNLATDVANLKSDATAQSLRNEYGADLVLLQLANGGGYCGRAYDILNPVSTAWAPNGYAVVAYDCSSSNKSFAHELGHLMGARHDWYVDGTNGSPYTYNHGYSHLSAADPWRTVMAYNYECADAGYNCPRQLFFSNPNGTHNGAPSGVPEGATEAADNHKALNNTRSTVAAFRTARSVTVTAPNGGQAWVRGTAHTITWSRSLPAGAYVAIELYKGGVFDSTIAAETPNDGLYSWSIPAGQTPGTDYRVKISWTAADAISDQSNANFSITDPSITVTAPVGGNLYQRVSYNITWTSAGAVGTYVRIILEQIGSGTTWTIAAATPNDGLYSWSPPTTIPAGTYRIRVNSTTYPTIFGYGGNFTIVVPTITVLLPNSAPESWEAGTTHPISWSSSPGTGATVRIYLYANSGGTFNRTITASTPNDGLFYWTIPVTQAAGTSYRVKIISNSFSGYADFSDTNFTITRPTITVTQPSGSLYWAGGSMPVRWDHSPGSGPSVQLALFKDGVFNRTIAASTPNDGIFDWTIPNAQTPDSNYKVKITSLAAADVWDMSESDSRIEKPYFVLDTPSAAGISWFGGSTQTISWRYGGPVTNVRIDAYKGATFIGTVVAGTANDGLYDWPIPFSLVSGNDYRLKISAVSFPTISDVSDNPFTILRPTISVTDPSAAGVVWWQGQSKTITWTSTGLVPTARVKIELFKGGVFNRFINVDTDNDGAYAWQVPYTITPGADYKIKVTSLDARVITDMSDNNFVIKQSSVRVLAPNGGESWNKGAAKNITWKATGGTNVRIELMPDSGILDIIRPSTEEVILITESTPNDGLYEWAIPGLRVAPAPGNYRIKITLLMEQNMRGPYDFSDRAFTILDEGN